MKIVRTTILVLAGLLLAFVVFLAGSVIVDALVGGSRVEQLTNTEIAGPDGQMIRAYVARPDAPGTYPGVVMIHEFFGLRPDVVEKAEALADEGYVVVAPDTSRGKTTGWIPRAIFLRITTRMEQVVGDLDATFDWLAGQSDVDPERVAVMGFCYGGDAALQYSLAHAKPAATGIFYGSLVTDPAQLSRLPGPVLGIFGAEDASIPLGEVEGSGQLRRGGPSPPAGRRWSRRIKQTCVACELLLCIHAKPALTRESAGLPADAGKAPVAGRLR